MKREDVSYRAIVDLLSGSIAPDLYPQAVLLLFEMKKRTKDLKDKKDVNKLYEMMLSAADALGMGNPFHEAMQFVKIYSVFENIELDAGQCFEQMLPEVSRRYGYSSVSNPLLNLFESHFKEDTKSVLIADGYCFAQCLRGLVSRHPDCRFTVSTEKLVEKELLNLLLQEYDNVEVVVGNAYRYEGILGKYDLIFCVPVFGVRTLAGDPNFICRELDAVATENLLLHTSSNGRLVIVVPARLTFAQGRTAELRRFIQNSYSLKEISELPEGTFESTGIKTYLLVIDKNGEEDITVRRYKAEPRKNRRTQAGELLLEDETFVMRSELVDQDDWNVNKIFSQQDEDWIKFRDSSVRRVALGEVSEVFRGKNITQKDPNGSLGIINISNIGDYDIDYDSLEYISEEERRISNYVLKSGDVLIPARGTAIRAGFFEEQSFPCIASSNVIVIRPNPKELDSTYLQLFLSSPFGMKLIGGMQQGSIVINISYKDLTALEIPLPPLDEQHRISEEYKKELILYKETISAAEQRWNEALERLRKF